MISSSLHNKKSYTKRRIRMYQQRLPRGKGAARKKSRKHLRVRGMLLDDMWADTSSEEIKQKEKDARVGPTKRKRKVVRGDSLRKKDHEDSEDRHKKLEEERRREENPEEDWGSRDGPRVGEVQLVLT